MLGETPLTPPRRRGRRGLVPGTMRAGVRRLTRPSRAEVRIDSQTFQPRWVFCVFFRLPEEICEGSERRAVHA